MSVQSIALILEGQSIAKDMFKHLGPGMIHSFLGSRTMKIGLWVLHPPTSHEGFFLCRPVSCQCGSVLRQTLLMYKDGSGWTGVDHLTGAHRS